MDAKQWLFVSLNSEQKGAVVRCSLDGKIDHRWMLQSSTSGLDVDVANRVLYVASSDSSLIYSIDLKQSTVPQQVGYVPGGKSLGPIVLQLQRQLLYVADIQTGSVYEVSLQNHKSRVLATDLGSPQALLLSAGGDVLYVADSAGRKIYSLNLTDIKPRRSVIAAMADFRSPSGLARLAQGEIVVSDDFANKLFVLSRDGNLLYTYPSKH
jgi:sugar lactone lactonase YvrE